MNQRNLNDPIPTLKRVLFSALAPEERRQNVARVGASGPEPEVREKGRGLSGKLDRGSGAEASPKGPEQGQADARHMPAWYPLSRPRGLTHP